MTELPPRPPRRRMLPSVSDVVRELSLISTADAAVLFKVARQVCADELNRVKQGFESEPVEVLVERAKGFLEPSTLKAVPDAPQTPAPFSEEGESPFESTAAMDLKWDPAPEPLGDVGERTVSDGMTEMVPFAPPPSPQTVAPDEGPGESTLARLRHEADSVALSDMVTRLGATPPPMEPLAAAPSEAPPPPPSPSPEPEMWRGEPPRSAAAQEPPGFAREDGELFASQKPVHSAGLWTALALLVVIGGAIWLALRKSPSFKKPDEPGQEPASVSVPAAPTSTAEEAAAPTPVPPAPTPQPTVVKARPTPVPRTRPTLPAQPTAAAVAVAPSPELVTPAAPRPVPPAASTGRGARMVTPDWSGKEPIYVIHFSSYKDRASAEKEARSLGGRLDHPGHAVQVDLGEKGIWYRVLIGEFESADAARAYRAELEAKRTPNMGFVYRLEGR